MLVAGCGGESRRLRSEPANDAGPSVINPLPDCVPVDDAGACPAPRIEIDPTIEGPVCAPGGFTILCAPEVSSYASGGCLALDPELHCGEI